MRQNIQLDGCVTAVNVAIGDAGRIGNSAETGQPQYLGLVDRNRGRNGGVTCNDATELTEWPSTCNALSWVAICDGHDLPFSFTNMGIRS
jgi:hypothetical protein